MKSPRGVVFSLLLIPQVVWAQVPKTPSNAPAHAVSGDAAARSGSAATPRKAEVPEGGGIPIDDEMLSPVPPPANILRDWREALEHVKTRSPDLLRAHARIEEARGRSRMALARSLPTLIGSGQLNHHLLTSEATDPLTGGTRSFPDPATTWSAGATLRVPILTARNWYDYGTSRDSIDRAKLQAEDAERLIIGGLAEAIVAVVTAERLAEVTRVNLTAALSTLELNKRRARLGSGNAVDVLRAKQEVTRSRAQVVDGDETLRRSREALGRALGYSDAWGVTPDLKLDQLRADARNTCTQGQDIAERSDVRAAAAGAAIAERNVNSVMYSYLPTMDLNSTLNHTSLANFITNVHDTWTIGASLTWHLYDGGLRYGESTTNEALYTLSQQDHIDIVRSATLEVTQATRGVHVARQSLQVAKEAESVAKDNAGLARTKFINGTGTSFDMVDTQSTARQATIDVTIKEFELLRAEIIAFLALAACKI